MTDAIKEIRAREILSTAGRPTVEVVLSTEQGIRETASVPSGTSKGQYEAFELHDGGKRYRGVGVRKAVENVNKHIAPAIIGKRFQNQSEIDQTLLELDGTPNKSKLGGNAILPVSVACAKAGAKAGGLPCYRYLGDGETVQLPVPLATVIAGGKHSPSTLDFEDYLFVVSGFHSFDEASEALVEARLTLGNLLEKKFGPIPEDGGALAPPITDSRQAFDLMLEAIDRSGNNEQITLGLDVAANEFHLRDENRYQVAGKKMTTDELISHYENLVSEYPLVYIEDPFHEDDYAAFSRLTSRLPDIRIVGDDLYASNPLRIKQGALNSATNALLLKINQIGTVSEAKTAAEIAKANHMAITVSVRSRETNDDFISDFSVAVGADQIKLGSPLRGERIAKYNRLLAIEQDARGRVSFAGNINIRMSISKS